MTTAFHCSPTERTHTGAEHPWDPTEVPPARVPRARYVSTVALVAIGASLVGCGAPNSDAAPAPEQTAEVAQEFSLGVDSGICTAMSALKNVFPGVPDTKCAKVKVNTLRYEGGFVPSGGVSDLFELPAFTNTLIQCAVSHSNHQSAREGAVSTKIGKFGMESGFSVNKQSVSPQFVEGERMGTIYMFGAGATLDVESLRFDTSTEQRTAGTMPAVHMFTGQPYTQNVDSRTGIYLQATTETSSWSIGGTITIPLASPISLILKPSVTRTPLFETLGNGMVWRQGSSPNALFDFNTRIAAQLNCIATCTGFGCATCPPDPTAAQLAEHERACNGTPGSCNYLDFTDNVLPYDGPLGGATQDSLFDHPQIDWIHFGPTGTGGGLANGIVSGSATGSEPAYNLGASTANASTKFGLDIQAGYSFGPASISVGLNTTLNMRSGFAVRKLFQQGVDGSNTASIQTALDSQSAVQVDLSLEVDFGIFGPFTASFPILNQSTANTPSALVSINYNPVEHSQAFSFNVAGRSLDPNTEVGKCLQSPTDLVPTTFPDDPGPFLTNVGKNSIKTIHPCKAAICDNGKMKTCDWQTSSSSDVGGNFVCQATQTTCNSCDAGQILQMCDANNNVLIDANGHPVQLRLIPNGCTR